MHFENASPRAIRPEREADLDDDDGLLADLDGCLLAEPPHAAIATEQSIAASTVRTRTGLLTTPKDDISFNVVVNPPSAPRSAQTERL